MKQSICNNIVMEILETPVKEIKAFKKRTDEFLIYDHVNKVNPSIGLDIITNSLKRWLKCEKFKTNHVMVKVPITGEKGKLALVMEWTYLIPECPTPDC